MSELRPIDDGLWVAEGDNYTGFGTWFPVRMVVARLDDGLWVHSPIALAPFADAIDALGPVRWIVNPCGFHGKWVPDAVARWPEAAHLSSSGHALRGSSLPAWQPLDPGPHAEWAAHLDQLLIAGAPKVAESVFLHRRSRTLICTDLLFNIHTSKTWLMPWVLRMVGAWQRPAQSRLWRRLTVDRPAAAAACRQLLTWDFDRVIMAHGDILEGPNAKAALRAALAWMLAG